MWGPRRKNDKESHKKLNRNQEPSHFHSCLVHEFLHFFENLFCFLFKVFFDLIKKLVKMFALPGFLMPRENLFAISGTPFTAAPTGKEEASVQCLTPTMQEITTLEFVQDLLESGVDIKKLNNILKKFEKRAEEVKQVKSEFEGDGQ